MSTLKATHFRYVTVQCKASDNQDGTFTLEIPITETTPMEAKVIENLFPNLSERVFKLLDCEAILSVIK